MAEYLSPGVYIEEFNSLGQPIQGVSTSIGGFLGLAEKGPSQGRPVLVTSMSDFHRTFGSYLPVTPFGDYRFLAYAVEQFFANGGSRCYVMRALPPTATKSSLRQTVKGKNVIFDAKSEGSWGRRIKLRIIESSAAADTEFTLKVYYGEALEPVEVFACNLEPRSDRYVETLLKGSEFLDAKVQENPPAGSRTATAGEQPSTAEERPSAVSERSAAVSEERPIPLAGGDDGQSESMSLDQQSALVGKFKGSEGSGPGQRTGIQAFLDVQDVNILAVPGVTDTEILKSLYEHCEKMASRFAVLDAPLSTIVPRDLVTWRNGQLGSTDYAALYHPWLEVYDPLLRRNTYIPPSGSVMGIYARTDNERGVFKAPANANVINARGLKALYREEEQNVLNPVGVNLIRSFPGHGIKVWGARTLSTNLLWRYVNVRRLFIYLEQSIKHSTNWVVFEPNSSQLWGRVERTLIAFLTEEWRRGALMGNSPEQAFYVKIGPQTMTQLDIDNRRLICEIGVAPVKPAEFVIFRITQTTAKLDS